MDKPLPDFFSDRAVIDDPADYFSRIRAICPVQREPYQGAYMVTGYDELTELLNRKDDGISSCLSVLGPIPPLPFEPHGDDIGAQLDEVRDRLPWSAHLVCFDGARHAEHRTLITSLLTYRRIRQNEQYLRSLADRLIDGFASEGQCNVVVRYAHATTTFAISDFMGIPESDRAVLLEAIGAPPSQIEGDAQAKVGPDPLAALKDLFDGYLRERLERPRDDLLTELVQSKFRNGEDVPFETLSNLARFLFGAGQDTTSHLISMAVRILAEDSDLQERLRVEPARIGDFIEEVLRFDPPVKAAYRLAVRDTELAGIPLPAGSVMTACLSAANRDPRRFENPDAFDIDRAGLRDHIAFSRGLHACPGAPLGRMEAGIAIERLLARTKRIELDETRHGPPENRHFRFVPTYTFRSLVDLHIKFEMA